MDRRRDRYMRVTGCCGCRGRAAVHGRLVRLGGPVRPQQRGVGAIRERRQHIRDMPVWRRHVRRHQRPAHRRDLRGVQLLGPRLQRAGRNKHHQREVGRPTGARKLLLGHILPSPAERRRGHRATSKPVLRDERLGQTRLADVLRRPRRNNPPRATRLLRSPPVLPRRRGALAQRRGDDRGPDPTVDLLERSAGERAVGERSERHVPTVRSRLRRRRRPEGRRDLGVAARSAKSYLQLVSARAVPSRGIAAWGPARYRGSPGWRHTTCACPPIDAAGNPLSVARRATSTTPPPDPVVPVVVGGDAWRRTNEFRRDVDRTRRTRGSNRPRPLEALRAGGGCVLRGRDSSASYARTSGFAHQRPGITASSVARGRRRKPARSERCRRCSGSVTIPSRPI